MSTLEATFRGRLGDFVLDAALSAPARGVTVLFGPSGCGKTTVLRCIAGLTRLTGRLSVAGEVWQDDARFLPSHKRSIGYVFQEPSLFEHLSVRRNLEFGQRRATGVQRIGLADVVDLLGLSPLMERGPGRLSGGERQRVSIGRALLSQPALLLMDEPLASLDAARKGEVLPYLERLHDELAVPIVYVTHDLGEAARLGDRIALMSAGRITRLIDIAAMPRDGGAGLAADLEALGPDRLAAELATRAGSDLVARLAVAALLADLPPWTGT